MERILLYTGKDCKLAWNASTTDVGDFHEAIEFACKEYRKYYPYDEDTDKPCKHKYPEKSIFCKG